MDRWACKDDLKNYFRIRDLLGGLTEPQKRQLRENIGITVNEGGTLRPTEITQAELYSMSKSNELITGTRYLITDFQTIYKNNQDDVWGTDESDYPSEKYSLIVTAISTDKLDPRVIISEHPTWTVEYDITSEIISPTVVTKGKITFLRDDNNNSAFYDFKNVRYARTYVKSGLTTTKAFYTFSTLYNGEILDFSSDESVHDNEICKNSYNNVFVGRTYYIKIDPDCYNNTFLEGCHDVHLCWESINNIFYEEVIDLSGTIAGKIIPDGDDLLSDSSTKHIYNVDGNTVMVNFDKDTFAQQITLIPDRYSQQNVTGVIYSI